jgi:hypothetical protein
MDIPLVGRAFMWLNNLDPFSWSRIDKFLVSSDWKALFPEVSQEELTKAMLKSLPYSF